jgi:hypothetical protein
MNLTLKNLAAMNVHPQRPAREGRSHYHIAFISDPDGNVIELMQIQPRVGDLPRLKLASRRSVRAAACLYSAP